MFCSYVVSNALKTKQLKHVKMQSLCKVSKNYVSTVTSGETDYWNFAKIQTRLYKYKHMYTYVLNWSSELC